MKIQMKTTSSHAISVQTSAMLVLNLLRTLNLRINECDDELRELTRRRRDSAGWSISRDRSLLDELQSCILSKGAIREQLEEAHYLLAGCSQELQNEVRKQTLHQEASAEGLPVPNYSAVVGCGKESVIVYLL